MHSLSSHPRTACPYLKLTFKTVQGEPSELRVPGPSAASSTITGTIKTYKKG